jgi:hypothetical protein
VKLKRRFYHPEAQAREFDETPRNKPYQPEAQARDFDEFPRSRFGLVMFRRSPVGRCNN